MTLDEIRKFATPACKEFNVKKLDVFGSLVRNEGTSGSDVDLLVEFENPTLHAARRYFGLLHRLEDVLGCEIDLLTISGLRNPYFLRHVLKEKITIYEG